MGEASASSAAETGINTPVGAINFDAPPQPNPLPWVVVAVVAVVIAFVYLKKGGR